MQKISLCKDAFSSGQIGSKIWLCQELENLGLTEKQTIWILGGWHALSAFLLLSRQVIPVETIRSFDIDDSATEGANNVLEYWVWQSWKFRAFTADCNGLDYADGSYGNPPSIVINTSVEHFGSRSWYDRIPAGTIVALQSNNMPHEDHVISYQTLGDFNKSFPMKTCFYQGELEFKYPSWGFTRYMRIGVKD